MNASQSPSRTPMFRRARSSRPKDIADSSDRMDYRPVGIHLAAQPVDQHVHNVCLRIKTKIKDVLQDHRLGHDPVWITHEVFQQSEFARLQLDLLTPASHLSGAQI